MKHIFINTLLFLFITSVSFASDSNETNEFIDATGKWIADKDYSYKDEHAPILTAVKNWYNEVDNKDKDDVIYSIREDDDGYFVFLEYISAYTIDGMSLGSVGAHTGLSLSKEGEIIYIHLGI
mgnify:CR=1 FL=1